MIDHACHLYREEERFSGKSLGFNGLTWEIRTLSLFFWSDWSKFTEEEAKLSLLLRRMSLG